MSFLRFRQPWLACVVGLGLLVIAAAQVSAQEPVKCKSKNGDTRNEVSYRIAKQNRTVESKASKYPPTLVLYISIKERHFNDDDMLALAKQLNEDFCQEPRLGAFIFGDHDAAKRFTLSEESSDYALSRRAWRGNYNLDRKQGEEFITFSTDRSTPQIRKTLELRTTSSNLK